MRTSGVINIQNTIRVHFNLVEQYWYNHRMIVFRYLGTLIEIFRRLAKKEKKLIVVILRIRLLEWLVESVGFLQPPGSPKKIKWGLLEITTILNTTGIHFNLAK